MNRSEIQLFIGVLLIASLAGSCSAAAFCPFGDSGGSGSSGVSLFNDLFSSPEPCSSGSIVASGESVDPFQPIDLSSSQVPCPFDDSGTSGSVDPFQPIDPSSSQVPCPFDDSGTSGSVDPFQPIDPTEIVLPCPFPHQSDSSEELHAESAACEAVYPAPTDPDNDGCYEDLNGNGRIDFADVTLYFRNMEWIRSNQPLCCFDYNGNGCIDFADLIMLFHAAVD
jgi:PKD repeat protein